MKKTCAGVITITVTANGEKSINWDNNYEAKEVHDTLLAVARILEETRVGVPATLTAALARRPTLMTGPVPDVQTNSKLWYPQT